MAQFSSTNIVPTKQIIAYEFFSGIGGFHTALKQSCNGHVLKAFEINPKCTKVYQKNFPSTTIVKKTIDSLKLDDLTLEGAVHESLFFWLLSPPCQPFTRSRRSVDNNVDDNDTRTKGFIHLIENLLSKICSSKNIKHRKPDVIFIENVVGFENSRTRARILKILVEKLGYQSINEYILDSQEDFGIPNQRPRYYGVYSSCDNNNNNNNNFHFDNKNGGTKQYINSCRKNSNDECNDTTQKQSVTFNKVLKTKLSQYLENNSDITFDEIPQEVMLKAIQNHVRYDISLVTDNTSACLSKGYGKFPRGYGPLLLYKIDENLCNDDTNMNSFKHDMTNSLKYELKLNVKQDLAHMNCTNNSSNNSNINNCNARRRDYFLVWRTGMRLRYLTPRECLRLLYFPEDFSFPNELSTREKLSLCGNSLNVKVVEEILKKTLKSL